VSAEPFLEATKASYDATVVEYVEMVVGLLEAKPLDRALLVIFAELVRASPVIMRVVASRCDNAHDHEGVGSENVILMKSSTTGQRRRSAGHLSGGADGPDG
jgi:hypothetical protein